jgi:cell division protein FtsN
MDAPVAAPLDAADKYAVALATWRLKLSAWTHSFAAWDAAAALVHPPRPPKVGKTFANKDAALVAQRDQAYREARAECDEWHSRWDVKNEMRRKRSRAQRVDWAAEVAEREDEQERHDRTQPARPGMHSLGVGAEAAEACDSAQRKEAGAKKVNVASPIACHIHVVVPSAVVPAADALAPDDVATRRDWALLRAWKEQPSAEAVRKRLCIDGLDDKEEPWTVSRVQERHTLICRSVRLVARLLGEQGRTRAVGTLACLCE